MPCPKQRFSPPREGVYHDVQKRRHCGATKGCGLPARSRTGDRVTDRGGTRAGLEIAPRVADAESAMSRMPKARTTASLSSARPAPFGNARDGDISAPPRCRRQWRPGFAPTSRQPTPSIWQRNTGPSRRRRVDRSIRRLRRRGPGQSRSRQRMPNVKTSCRPFVRPDQLRAGTFRLRNWTCVRVSWIRIWPTRGAEHKLRMRALRLLHESLGRRAPLAIAAPNASAL